MRIEIDAHEMLQCLVDAGIDANDAKAIVLDLILASDSSKEKKREVRTAPPPPPPQPARAPQPRRLETREVAPPEEERPYRTTIRKSVSGERPTFSEFGGAAETLK